TFGHDHERFLVDPVLPRIQPEVNPATEKPGLETSFIVPSNDLAFAQRTFAAPDLFNDANLSVRDINDPEQSRQAEQKYQRRKRSTDIDPWGQLWKSNTDNDANDVHSLSPG